MFFLATADAEGRPDVSYKGGMPGFVRVTGPAEVAFPDYNGNGMFKSLGAILENPNVRLLFIRWSERPKRLRVLGTASIDERDPLMSEFEGCQQVVRVKAERIFDNCPRYIHRMELQSYSPFAPAPGNDPPMPEWKRNPNFEMPFPLQTCNASMRKKSRSSNVSSAPCNMALRRSPNFEGLHPKSASASL